MSFPRGDEYVAAVQHPNISFSDADLRSSSVESNNWGLPKPYSGGFTTTFQLKTNSKSWAVRCFTRPIADLEIRYKAIGQFLCNKPADFFVNAELLQNGIKVNNSWYPVIKMDWLKGESLNDYISHNLHNSSSLKQLVTSFVDLVRRLEALKIAHGDLQHGNILVKQGKLYLIDYDGMYLTSISALKTNEIGHINYQHPDRTMSFNKNTIDRFSSIVIYLGLKALIESPSLWDKYDNSENILFKAQDFVNIESSRLISDLFSISNLKSLVERFCGVCKLPIDQTPQLDTFISGEFNYKKISLTPGAGSATKPIARSQFLVIDAKDTTQLLQNVGNRVEVVGLITDYFDGLTKYQRPFLFLNFGKYPDQTFTLVFWSDIIRTYEKSSKTPLSFVNKRVKITGIITAYMGNPNMVIENPSQIQILEGSNNKGGIPDTKQPKLTVMDPAYLKKSIPPETKVKIKVDPRISGSSSSGSYSSGTSSQKPSFSNISPGGSSNQNYSTFPQIKKRSGCIILFFILNSIISCLVFLFSYIFKLMS